MVFPRGFPKGLDFGGCLNVTLVLKDFQVLTGRFKGLLDEDGKRGCADHDHHDKHKHDEKCCKPPKVDVDVDVDEKPQFILLELTRPAAAVNLSTFTCDLGGTDLTVVLSGTTFPVGSCVAVNVDSILYAGTDPEFCDIPIITPGNGGGGGFTLKFGKQ